MPENYSNSTKVQLKSARKKCTWCGWIGKRLPWVEIEPGFFDEACPNCQNHEFIHTIITNSKPL